MQRVSSLYVENNNPCIVTKSGLQVVLEGVLIILYICILWVTETNTGPHTPYICMYVCVCFWLISNCLVWSVYIDNVITEEDTRRTCVFNVIRMRNDLSWTSRVSDCGPNKGTKEQSLHLTDGDKEIQLGSLPSRIVLYFYFIYSCALFSNDHSEPQESS